MRHGNFDSIGTVALRNHGNTTGFDYLRLGLSLAVVIQHCVAESNSTCYIWILEHKYVWFFILPAFFALSGYLVAGSLFRNSIPQFLLLRVIRIVPALAVEVILSATLLGFAFTSLPIKEYVTSREFIFYFLNIVGDIHFTLPGVFKGNFVNVQLWTIPYELRCYILLVAIAATTLTSRQLKRYFPATLVTLALAFTFWATYKSTPGEAQLHLNGRALEIAFLWACAIYVFRERLPYSSVFAVSGLAIGIVGMEYQYFQYLSMIPIAYATVFIGLMHLPRIPFGDLSYGLFLFHYPIMQMFRLEAGINNTLLLSIFTIMASGLFALVSWNFIEEPILGRKKAVLTGMATLEKRVISLFWRTIKSNSST